MDIKTDDRSQTGLIHIYTGDGKGKTTAAVGLTIRCVGSGRKAVFAQFLKDNTSSELNVLNNIEGIRMILSEKSFGFYFNMTETEKLEARETYSRQLIKAIDTAINGNYQMLVLDEIIATYNNQFIDHQYFLDFLKNKPPHLEVVLTGRNPVSELIDLADYVSEIKKIKHPFDYGIAARTGIEK